MTIHTTADHVDLDAGTSRKESELHEILRGLGSAMIGFSGGVDSAFLAKAALDALGPERVLAVTGLSPSYPDVQRRMALRVVREFRIPHLEIETRELDDPDYAANPRNRCYFCKSHLYERLAREARERGYDAVLDGTNADDRNDHRPGAAAARELGVRSPLEEAELTKAEIRALSKRDGLPTWDLPAAPCLASRITYGLPVTEPRLGQVERAEAALRAAGDGEVFGDLRVRHHGDWARLEVAPDRVPRLADRARRERAAQALRAAGFERACLDLAGYRRGALNERASPGRGSAEERLRALGLRAATATAGTRDEILVIRAADSEEAERILGARRERVIAECRSAGFRHAALELFSSGSVRPAPD